MGFLKKLGDHLVAPKATINLMLSDQYAVLGDNLEGTLTVTAHETIDAEEIRCELSCMETVQVSRTEYDAALKRPVTRQFTENRVLYQTKAVCSPATQLVPEVSIDFKLSVCIPAGARPTFMSAIDNVEWQIKGVVAVHGRPDVTTSVLQFQVIAESQRPVNEAPKVRLVPCEYCQALMPDSALVCPNCGARRKA
jgi:hypothetical protein